MDNILKRYKNIALSDRQLLQLLDGKSKIVLYPNIHKYKTIEQLLYPYDATIILFESKPNYGHWCLIFKRGKTLEFFNSYGGYPDDTLKHIESEFRDITNQNYTYLSRLVYNSNYNLEYNELKLQKLKNDIKTCGRHVVARLMFRHLSIKQYQQLLKKLSKEFKMDYDSIVTLLTIEIDK